MPCIDPLCAYCSRPVACVDCAQRERYHDILNAADALPDLDGTGRRAGVIGGKAARRWHFDLGDCIALALAGATGIAVGVGTAAVFVSDLIALLHGAR